MDFPADPEASYAVKLESRQTIRAARSDEIVKAIAEAAPRSVSEVVVALGNRFPDRS
jgi:hypothetical protein